MKSDIPKFGENINKRRKNPDKVRAANTRYWEKRAAKAENADGNSTSNSAK